MIPQPSSQPPIQAARLAVGQHGPNTATWARSLQIAPQPGTRIEQRPYELTGFGFGSLQGNETDRLQVQVPGFAAGGALPIACAILGFVLASR